VKYSSAGKVEPLPSGTPVTETLVIDDYRYGFQKSVGTKMSAGLGAKIQWWYINASGLKDAFWGYVGILPIVGHSNYSKRYTRTLAGAQNMGGRTQMPTAADIWKWDLGDSIKFVSDGGVVFSAGVGLNPAGVGAAAIANGTWETYVEKVSSHEAYVKITKGQLRGLTLFTVLGPATLQTMRFGATDDSFSFVYDLNKEVGRRAFEDMLHGNVAASEKINKQRPRDYVTIPPLLKIDSVHTASSGSLVNFNVYLPILWSYRNTVGNIQNFSSTDLHIGHNIADVNYGIYSREKSNTFLFRHTENSLKFYGAKYHVKDTLTDKNYASEFAKFHMSFDKEVANDTSLSAALRDLLAQTGQKVLKVNVPEVGNLGYAGYRFTVSFSAKNTLAMIKNALSHSDADYSAQARSQIKNYVYNSGDPYSICMGQYNDPSECERGLNWKTDKGAREMHQALLTMSRTFNTDSAAFAQAYGEFGEGMAATMFTFDLGRQIAGPDLLMSYLIQGTRLSMYMREWVTNSQSQWVPFVYSENTKRTLDPRFINSEARKSILLR
jgi:hypothetical protein